MTSPTEEELHNVEEYADVQPRRPRRRRTHHTVRLVTESGNDPVQFSHEDPDVVKQYVKDHHPRGGEVYTETPEGYREVYSADHEFQGKPGWRPMEEEE